MKYCVICKKKSYNKKCCGKDCFNEYYRNVYKTKLKEKKCSLCNKTFVGKYREILCPACRKIKATYKYKETYIQEIVCRQCGIVLKTIIKNKTLNPLYKKPDKTCDGCKEHNKREMSNRMKTNNPSYKIKISTEEWEKRKKDKELKRKEKSKKAKIKASKRMKNSNPMFNPSSVEKMRNTIKNKLKNGELKYKKGKEHHLFKGNRGVNKTIRTSLKWWVKEKLNNSNFRCEECGKDKCNLTVHHLEPFREILNKFIEMLSLRDPVEVGSDDFFKLSEAVEKYHKENPSIGIVLCEECHIKTDEYFKKLNVQRIKK